MRIKSRSSFKHKHKCGTIALKFMIKTRGVIVLTFRSLYRIFLFVLSMISVDGFFNQLVGDMK